MKIYKSFKAAILQKFQGCLSGPYLYTSLQFMESIYTLRSENWDQSQMMTAEIE